MITRNQTEINGNSAAIRGDVTETQRDASDAKKMAAKATTLAEETQQAVKSLEQRMANLESGGSVPKTPPGLTPRRGPRAPSPTKRDWDFLGGDEGDTLIVGLGGLGVGRIERSANLSGIRPNPTSQKPSAMKSQR